ncbi:MAG: DUF4332 domain-containing protein [Thermoproteota archaeon]
MVLRVLLMRFLPTFAVKASSDCMSFQLISVKMRDESGEEKSQRLEEDKSVRMKRRNWFKLYAPLLLMLVLLSLQTSLVLPAVTSLSTDKPEYLRGETVVISGKASPGEWVTILVKDPNGEQVFTTRVNAGRDGGFTSSFPLSSTAAYGTYTVQATPPSPPFTTTFKVVSLPPPPPPTPPPTPSKKNSSMTISVNKTSITFGESVMINGSLTPALSVAVSLRITCPNGTEVLKSISASQGEFKDSFKPDVSGAWNIRASWLGNIEYYGCSSNTVTLTVRTPVSLQILVTPLLTNVGGKIIVYVSTSPPLVDRPLTLSFIMNKTAVWSNLGAFNTGSEGIGACPFTPGETGKYRFKAEWAGDHEFMPASATSSEVLVMEEALSPDDIINALNKLKALQKQVDDLQMDLMSSHGEISSLESELAEAKSRLSEAESRSMLTSMSTLIGGLLTGFIVAFLLARAHLFNNIARKPPATATMGSKEPFKKIKAKEFGKIVAEEPPTYEGAVDEPPTYEGAWEEPPTYEGAVDEPPTYEGAWEEPPTYEGAVDEEVLAEPSPEPGKFKAKDVGKIKAKKPEKIKAKEFGKMEVKKPQKFKASEVGKIEAQKPPEIAGEEPPQVVSEKPPQITGEEPGVGNIEAQKPPEIKVEGEVGGVKAEEAVGPTLAEKASLSPEQLTKLGVSQEEASKLLDTSVSIFVRNLSGIEGLSGGVALLLAILLVKMGVDSREKLAQSDPKELHEKLRKVLKDKSPSLETIQKLVEAAKKK